MCFVLILAALFACSSKPYIVKPSKTTSGLKANKVYVVSHGWHTGFVVSATEIQSRLPKLAERFKSIPSIEFGWGDKGFYQAVEITTGLSLQAIFWPTEAVIHAVAVPDKVEKFFPHSEISRVCLSDSEYSSLINFISNSFDRTNDGGIIELSNGLYGNSQFYKGVGDYYLMNTCNKWTAKGLKSAGMDISHTFKLTASSIMDYLQIHSEVATIRPTRQAGAMLAAT